MFHVSDKKTEVIGFNIFQSKSGSTKQRRFFSLGASIILVLSTLLLGVSIRIPNANAAANMNVGNLDVLSLTEYGRILMPLNWGGHQTAQDPSTLSFIGLVIDHDNYDHTPGAEDIADCFNKTSPYLHPDDFKKVKDLTMLINDGTTQKSFGSFQNKGGGTGCPDDMLINQTCWVVKNKDWAIIQWTLVNVKSPTVDLTNVRIGLEVPISKEGSRFGLGGELIDGGDDVDGYDAGNAVYWAKDIGDGTTIGFASAIVSDPITHYYAKDYHANYSAEYVKFFGNDSWLYQRLKSPSNTATNGVTPGNITATIGWDGFDILAGESRTLTLVIAINNTYNSMITALKDAQYYYQKVVSHFQITEFSDSSSGIQQIEIYNFGLEPTDLITAGYCFSVDGGTSFLSGNWDKNPIPTYEYSVFTLDPGENIGKEGDTIGLYQHKGGGSYVLKDKVTFGQEGVAPDPLNGESVARSFDIASMSYTEEWLRNSSSGSTWGSQNDVLVVDTTPSVILNEVMFYPSVANGGYLVLINKEPYTSVNVRGYCIVCDTEYRLPDNTDIWLDPLTMMVIKYSDDPPLTSILFDNMDSGGDNVYLYDRYGNLLDMVGWNSPHLKGMSVRRSPDGSGNYQGYNDVTSQNAGWVFNTPLELIITEISDSGSAKAQIEVYNPRYPPMDLNVGYYLKSNYGQLSGGWTKSIVDSGEYSVFDVSTPNGLHIEGDNIKLYHNTHLIEEVSYGQKGEVPDPIKDESVQRYWDGAYYTDVWERNWTSGSNFGLQNDVPPPNFNSLLLLNEILFNPSVTSNGFVELYLKFGKLDISGYKIVCDSEYIIPYGTELSSDEQFFYLLQPNAISFFAGLTKTGDNVYLYDNNGRLLDMAGWSSLHTNGKSMVRLPSGYGGRNGFDDTSSIAAGWIFDAAPSIQLIKLKAPEPIKYGSFGGTIFYKLTIINKQSIDDVALIFSYSLNGYTTTILDETETYIISKIFVSAGSSVNVVIYVHLPSTVPFSEWDNITISIQSENNSLYGDSLILQAIVTPFIWPEKSASPKEIYYNGTGHDEVTTITLNLTGMGSKIREITPQDVIFCVDTSGSMTPVAIMIIKSGLLGYVDEMNEPDRGAVVVFNSGAWLLNPLTENYSRLRDDIGSIPGPEGSTYMGEAMEVAIEELLRNGNRSHIQVIILLTDGGWNGNVNPLDQADIAAANNITIFTIGLKPNSPYSLDEVTLKEIANKTGGQYFYADNPTQIPEIYKLIAAYIGDIAGRDIDITDSTPMVRDVLPPWIILVPGSFSIPPDVNYVDENGYRILEWNISSIRIGESWEVSFQVKSTRLGLVPTNDVDGSRIYFVDYFDEENFRLFPECFANVLPPSPLPPKLYIDILPNKDDIYLYWDEPITPGTDHYLIYRATTPTGFDFSSPWVDTNNTLANGIDPVDKLIIPLRRSWNHTGAADPRDKEYSEQLYYCIRTVNCLGEISHTSRTVGKWTKIFLEENSTFSLPLEPLVIRNTEFYAQDMDARFIKWMNSTHNWVQHDKGEIGDNTNVEVGKGYEVSFAKVDKKYTFLGMPGAQIMYNSYPYVGFDYNTDAKSLSASVNQITGNVTLKWDKPSGFDDDDNYYVYNSTTRDGFDGTLNEHYFLLATVPFGISRGAVHLNAALSGTQNYYMIIPVNENMVKGAGTYSIGLWTANYQQEYDTLGIPLILESYPTADWYCDQMEDAVGINYLINQELGWGWHSTRMPKGAYDPILEITVGYQLSTSGSTKYTFIGH